MAETRYLILRKPREAKSPGSLRRGSLQATRATTGATLGIAVESATPSVAASLAREPEVVAITPAMPTRLIPYRAADPSAAATDWGLHATGAAASAFDGEGVKIAVLDTGIFADHSAFDGIAIVQEDFSGSGNGDAQGHGTHCAGTIFGRDVSGQRIGVARGITEAFIGKVLTNDGSGNSEVIFQGMQWALSKGANIISMSLGFDFPGMVSKLESDGLPWNSPRPTRSKPIEETSECSTRSCSLCEPKGHRAR